MPVACCCITVLRSGAYRAVLPERRWATVMTVRFVTPGSVRECGREDVPALLERDDGFVWLDLAECADGDAELLREVFGCHPLAVQTCLQRNPVATLYSYADQVFVVSHTPLVGHAGHVHLLELDVFVGRRFLVTVHGPLNPAVPVAEALVETSSVVARIEQGRLAPSSPAELSYAIATAVARRQRSAIDVVARKIAAIEQRVMRSDFRNPEQLLTEMYLIRHELLTVRTMAAQSCDVYTRMAHLMSADDERFASDLADQYDRVRSVADGEKEFLVGVIDLYHSRVTTKMTVAMERLAVLAAVTLPVTALASVYGMNVIVNDSTRFGQLAVALVVMASISIVLLRWTKRQGWW